MKWYPYLEVMAKRPLCYRVYLRFLLVFPLAEELLRELWIGREKSFLTINTLMKMMEGDDEEGLINATRALEETLRQIGSDIDSVLVTLL